MALRPGVASTDISSTNGRLSTVALGTGRKLADNETAVVIPRWFIWVISSVWAVGLVTFLPWAVWTTSVSMRVGVQLEQVGKVLDANAEKLDAVSAEQQRRTGSVYRVEALERRLENLESGQRNILERVSKDAK
jgi:nucleotide-binding universal stress UspA family protein